MLINSTTRAAGSTKALTPPRVQPKAVDRVLFSGAEQPKTSKSIFKCFTEKIESLWNKFKDAIKDFFNKLFLKSKKDKPSPVNNKSHSEADVKQPEASQNSSEEKTEKTKPGTKLPSHSVPRPVIQNAESETTATPEDDARMLRRNDALLDRDLGIAKELFSRRARHGNEADRRDNALTYGKDVFSALTKYLERSSNTEGLPLLNDVRKITDDLRNISNAIGQKENFAELTDETQDQIIDLIQFSLKHPEPLIRETGIEMAQSLGISESTIEHLKQE